MKGERERKREREREREREGEKMTWAKLMYNTQSYYIVCTQISSQLT